MWLQNILGAISMSDTSQRTREPASLGIPSQPEFVQCVAGGMHIKLKVIAGASRSRIVGGYGDRLKIKVAAPPEQGKANQAVVALLKQWLGTDAVEIIAGHGSAMKTVKVSGMVSLSNELLAQT